MDSLSKWLKGAVGAGSANEDSSSKPKKSAQSKKSRSTDEGTSSEKTRGGRKPTGRGNSRNSNRRGSSGGHQASGRGNSSGGRGGRAHGKPAPKSKAPAKQVRTKMNTAVQKGVMRIIPIGGLEEVGKNAMIVEHEDDILVVDMGFQFPEDEMLGVDYVIPDIQYLVQRKKRIRGILITHGHLDHIGALPYVLEDLGWPTIYGSKLSLGLVKSLLERHRMLKEVTLKEVTNNDHYRFGSLEVDFFRVNHSIPDSVGMVIRSPEGSMVHTGDFKFDFTPADGIEADIGKMAEIGKKGVNIMFSDSTNALKPGHTLSERVVGENLKKSIQGEPGRVIIACFASLIGRVQQIVDFAHAEGRKVFFSGGSMVRNVAIAQELGFLKIPKGVMKEIRNVNDFRDDEVLILTTGSQGEPMAALSRMASRSHAQVQLKPGDAVVLSSSPIIGNEKSVAFLIDQLARLGAKIIHNRIMDVHTSGHGNQEDLKMMMTLIKPDHLVPVHGNFYMRRAHGDLGPKVGIPSQNIHMMDNGNIIEIRKNKVSFKNEDIGVRFVVIDGHGQGDLGSIVQHEREAMSKNGVLDIIIKMRKGKMVGKPVVTMHGFVYQEEGQHILKEIESQVQKSVTKLKQKDPKASAQNIADYVKGGVSGLIVRKLDRRPLVLTKVLHV